MNESDINQILGTIEYRDWKFEVQKQSGRNFLRVIFITGEGVQKGRWWRLSPHMTKGEIVQTAFKAVITAEEHEAREHFLYMGRAIFGPHLDVDHLHEIADCVIVRKEPV